MLYVFLQSIGLPVFPTGAIVVACTEKENMISPDPGLPLGWGGALPALASQGIHYECARVHCLLSPDVLLVVWQAARTILSDSLMHWWLSFLGYGSSGGCYAGRHCSYSDAAYSFLQYGSALRGGVNMYGVSVELFAA